MMRSPTVPIYCAARILLDREDARQIAPVSIKMYNIAFREGGEKQGYYHATAHINIFGRDKHHGVHTVLKESIVPGSCGRHDWHAQLRICKHGMAAAAARGEPGRRIFAGELMKARISSFAFGSYSSDQQGGRGEL